MSIRIKDLPFTDFYKVENKSTKKIQKVVFPNKLQLGVNSDLPASLEIFGNSQITSGNLDITGSLNTTGSVQITGTLDLNGTILGRTDLSGSLHITGSLFLSGTDNTINLQASSITIGTDDSTIAFQHDGTQSYAMTETLFTSNNEQDLGSSGQRWGELNARSGSFTDQVDGKLKHYIHFHFVNSTDTGVIYIPWYSTLDSTSITDPDSGLTVVRPGRVLRVALRSDTNIGNTVVSFHRNESATIIDSDSSSLTAGDRDVFTFSDSATFVAGDELHIGINPTSTGDEYHGMVEFEFDTDGSVGS